MQLLGVQTMIRERRFWQTTFFPPQMRQPSLPPTLLVPFRTGFAVQKLPVRPCLIYAVVSSAGFVFNDRGGGAFWAACTGAVVLSMFSPTRHRPQKRHQNCLPRPNAESYSQNSLLNELWSRTKREKKNKPKGTAIAAKGREVFLAGVERRRLVPGIRPECVCLPGPSFWLSAF